MARSIVASYYYDCVSQVCAIAACAFEADGRLSELFMPFKQDKKKDKEWNRREEAQHRRSVDKFRHRDGDYFSMLSLFTEFKKHMQGADAVSAVASDDGVAAAGESLDYERTDDVENVKIGNGAREKRARAWCRENNTRFNVLMRAYKTARELESTVKDEIKHMAKRRPGWTFEHVVHNVNGWDSDRKISLALAIGNRGMLAKLTGGQGSAHYVSTFAEIPKPCKISQDSLMRPGASHVMFYEMFATAENMKYYKMNMVSAVAPDIVKLISVGVKQ
jgi:hypothetical protein